MKKIILLDPGHGGDQPGACRDNTREAALNLDIALRIPPLLPDCEVFLTRDDDRTVSLLDRVNKQQQIGANFFISIHCDASESRTPQGYTVYHHPGSEKGKALATSILRALDSAGLGRISRGVLSPDNPLTPHVESFFVLAHTTCPACLVECGFMSNPEELAWLQVSENRQALAMAIARGIEIQEKE